MLGRSVQVIVAEFMSAEGALSAARRCVQASTSILREDVDHKRSGFDGPPFEA